MTRWTPEEDAVLTAAVFDNLTAGRAAELLPNRTRNGCIVRSQMLGLSFGPVKRLSSARRERIAERERKRHEDVKSPLSHKGVASWEDKLTERWADRKVRTESRRGKVRVISTPWTAAEDEILLSFADSTVGWSVRAAAALPGRTDPSCRSRFYQLEERTRRAGWPPQVTPLPWALSVIDEEEHLARINERGGFPVMEEAFDRNGQRFMTGRRVTAEGREWGRGFTSAKAA